MNFAVLITQLPSSAAERAQLLAFGQRLQPLPEGIFHPAENVWMATRADAHEFVHAAKTTAAECGIEMKAYSGDLDRRLLVS